MMLARGRAPATTTVCHRDLTCQGSSGRPSIVHPRRYVVKRQVIDGPGICRPARVGNGAPSHAVLGSIPRRIASRPAIRSESALSRGNHSADHDAHSGRRRRGGLLGVAGGGAGSRGIEREQRGRAVSGFATAVPSTRTPAPSKQKRPTSCSSAAPARDHEGRSASWSVGTGEARLEDVVLGEREGREVVRSIVKAYRELGRFRGAPGGQAVARSWRTRRRTHEGAFATVAPRVAMAAAVVRWPPGRVGGGAMTRGRCSTPRHAGHEDREVPVRSSWD